MKAVLRQRPDLEALPGGWIILQALQELVTALNTQPLMVGSVAISSGTGTPQNKVVGNIGDVYLRSDGSTSTTMWVKETGVKTNTGWVAK